MRVLCLAEGVATQAEALAATRTEAAAASAVQPEAPDKPILECKSLIYTTLPECHCVVSQCTLHNAHKLESHRGCIQPTQICLKT